MKLLFAADGSACTKKTLAFLVNNDSIAGADGDVLVLNVQAAMPHRIAELAGADSVKAYHRDEADKVLEPIKVFLDRHALRYRCEWLVGAPATEIVEAARRNKVHMIVMGTHGHGLVGSLLLGSVARRVLADSDVPVLLVK